MTFIEWVNEIERPAVKAIKRRQRREAWKQSRAGKFAKAAVKELGLLAVMATVTTGVVLWETGDIHKALHIASIAGPIKAAAAALYGRWVS